MQNKNLDTNEDFKTLENKKDKEIDASNQNFVDNSNGNLKKYISVIVLFLVGLEFVLNFVFCIQFEIKIVVEVVSIILSALIIFGVVKTDKKQEDAFKTKTEIENSILEEVKKFKNKK